MSESNYLKGISLLIKITENRTIGESIRLSIQEAIKLLSQPISTEKDSEEGKSPPIGSVNYTYTVSIDSQELKIDEDFLKLKLTLSKDHVYIEISCQDVDFTEFLRKRIYCFAFGRYSLKTSCYTEVGPETLYLRGQDDLSKDGSTGHNCRYKDNTRSTEAMQNYGTLLLAAVIAYKNKEEVVGSGDVADIIDDYQLRRIPWSK